MADYDLVIAFVAGVIFGAVLMRFGIKIGIKTVYLIREEIPLDELKPTEQMETS